MVKDRPFFGAVARNGWKAESHGFPATTVVVDNARAAVARSGRGRSYFINTTGIIFKPSVISACLPELGYNSVIKVDLESGEELC
jgi:hypothetical protein